MYHAFFKYRFPLWQYYISQPLSIGNYHGIFDSIKIQKGKKEQQTNKNIQYLHVFVFIYFINSVKNRI